MDLNIKGFYKQGTIKHNCRNKIDYKENKSLKR